MVCCKCKKTIDDIAVFCQFCGKKQPSDTKIKNTKSRGNGTGTVFKLPSGKWRAEYTLGYKDGKRFYRTKSGLKTKREALEYLSVLKNEPKPQRPVKFHELYDEWSAIHFKSISKSSIMSYKIAYKKCEPFHFYNRPLAKLIKT